MSIYQRIPAPPLSQYIAWLWYYVDYFPDHDRQFVLPDGTFELIINLEDRPRKLFDRHDRHRYRSFKRAWISGPHREYIEIDAVPGSTMIGAHFLPGGAASFIGVPCDELADRVEELDMIWGSWAWEWRERSQTAQGAQAKLALLEQLLMSRLGQVQAERARGVNWAVKRFAHQPHLKSIQVVTRELGISHKHFIEQFRREVGLTPKLFCRILRFQQVLRRIHERKAVRWADVANSCGYFDQAHFINDFGRFAGVNPSAYLTLQMTGDPKFIRAAAAR